MDLRFAAEHDQQIADHGGLALLVEIDDVFFGQFLERHVDHAHRAVHDLLARGDDGLGLLAAQHGLRDLRCVGEMRDPGLLHLHAGLFEPLMQLLAQGNGHGVTPAPQREFILLAIVIGVAAGEMAHGRLALHGDVMLVVVDVEASLRGVLHAPDDDRGDFNGVAALVVHLEFFAVEVPGAE